MDKEQFKELMELLKEINSNVESVNVKVKEIASNTFAIALK